MIFGHGLKKIEAVRHQKPTSKGTINYDINFRQSSKHKNKLLDREVLRVEYALSINYLNPNIGYIRFEGWVDILSDEPTDKLDVKLTEEVVNFIMHNLSPLSMLLSSSVGLPPSIPLPSLKKTSNQRKEGDDVYYV